ncbi:SoxR reducing system RseC family protein [Lutibacter sp. B1]|uniref:SoxR reducing system RseC family protein n=1 Tax=Lutibacter sp. B1 TaxID=2725996 RepID=UPI0014578927|nr:SoxR reducing system RseC family protein [Lutibacter sp. B1]NLP58865.1 SoxR reducing system RseC family protein [Lutibacter sp. B1]
MEKIDLESYRANNKGMLTHAGVVSKISKNNITVSLLGDIHCEACNAKGACGVSDSDSKEIDIVSSEESFKLNESVEVVLKKELGLKAVFWAYVFPFILLLLTLIIASLFFKEWIAGLLSLFVLVPYYLMLYVLKDSFKKAFKISILKYT